ncbi:MAG: molybdopterin cofactor-binding domain-containing protein [Burkholderiales bacterium]
MNKTLNTSRRNFLKSSAAITGGLALGFNIDALAQGKATQPVIVPEANAWVVVRPDDTIIIRYARAEMGQGSMTSAPMLVAEELEANWNKVKVEYARASEQVKRKRAWGDMAAVGSRTIRNSQEYLRKAGAGAREMLVSAAAQRWAVPVSECVAANSVITHTKSGRKLTYGQVALAAAKIEPPKDPKIKDPKDFKLVGKPIPRIDIPDIVTGKIRYGIDAQVPGMLYASVAACPVFGGKVKSVDASKITGRRGIVKVLPMGDFVAVVADNWWRANQALKELPIEWDMGDNGAVTSASIMDFFKAGLTQTDIAVAKKGGDTDKGFADAAKVLEAEYFTPFLSHTTMEPMHCTALVKDGRVEVWTSSQNYEATLATAANTAGVPLENVEAHPMQLGGGLGRRGAQDYTRQGVMIAKAMEGTAVKMVWSREEDTQHDFYRPASLVKMKGGVDAQGNVTALYSRISSPSIIATLLKLPLKGGIDPQAVTAYADHPYAIPNVNIEYAQRNPHVPVGFWRTVGHSQNPYVRECFIDELAQAAGKDPLEFRRAMLKDSPRDLGILNAVAKAANWDKPLPAGVFRGIAETEGYGSYTASVAEVSVNDKNELKIHRMVIGIDCGIQVNPDNIIAQVQGSAVHGLTAIIWGEITIKDGRVEQGNFHDYRMMMLKEMPKIEVVLAPSGGFWGGVGEPAQAPIAPALVNAIAAATGKRIRSLPLKNHGITLA